MVCLLKIALGRGPQGKSLRAWFHHIDLETSLVKPAEILTGREAAHAEEVLNKA